MADWTIRGVDSDVALSALLCLACIDHVDTTQDKTLAFVITGLVHIQLQRRVIQYDTGIVGEQLKMTLRPSHLDLVCIQAKGHVLVYPPTVYAALKYILH